MIYQCGPHGNKCLSTLTVLVVSLSLFFQGGSCWIPWFHLSHQHNWLRWFSPEWSGCNSYLAGTWRAHQLGAKQHVLWLDWLREADLPLAAGQLQHGFRTSSGQVGLGRGELHPVITAQDGHRMALRWQRLSNICLLFIWQRRPIQNSDLDLDLDIGSSFGFRNLFPDSRGVRFAPASWNRKKTWIIGIERLIKKWQKCCNHQRPLLRSSEWKKKRFWLFVSNVCCSNTHRN